MSLPWPTLGETQWALKTGGVGDFDRLVAWSRIVWAGFCYLDSLGDFDGSGWFRNVWLMARFFVLMVFVARVCSPFGRRSPPFTLCTCMHLCLYLLYLILEIFGVFLPGFSGPRLGNVAPRFSNGQ